jgi:DNA polymerase III alpha subunit
LQTFEDFLEKVKKVKSEYATGQVKINASAVMSLIMSGAFDSLLPNTPSTTERFELIAKFKKAVGSTADFPKTKNSIIDMSEISSEFDRNLWMNTINPLFTFKICDQFSELLTTIGYVRFNTPNIRFSKPEEKTSNGLTVSNAVDVFGSHSSLFHELAIERYTNRNYNRTPAICAIYNGYETRGWGDGNKMRKVKMHDGTVEFEGTIWGRSGPGETKFDPILENKLKIARGTPCLFIGGLSKSKSGFKSFIVKDIVPFA